MMNIKSTVDWLIAVRKALRPKFYKRLTWAIVCVGLGLLSTKLLERILLAFLEKKWDLSLTGGYDQLVGVALIVIALTYNATMQHLAQRSVASSQP